MGEPACKVSKTTINFGYLHGTGKMLRSSVSGCRFDIDGTRILSSGKNEKLWNIKFSNVEELNILQQALKTRIESENWCSHQQKLEEKTIELQNFYWGSTDKLLSAWLTSSSKVFIEGRNCDHQATCHNRVIVKPVSIELTSISFDPFAHTRKVYASFMIKELHLGAVADDHSTSNKVIPAQELKSSDMQLLPLTVHKITGIRAPIRTLHNEWVLLEIDGYGTFPPYVTEEPSGFSQSKYKIKLPIVSQQVVQNLQLVHRDIEHRLLAMPEWPAKANLTPIIRQSVDESGFKGHPYLNTRVRSDQFTKIKYHGYTPLFVNGIPQLQGLEFNKFVVLLQVIYAQNTGAAGYSFCLKEIFFAGT